jgi:hypothetical protein
MPPPTPATDLLGRAAIAGFAPVVERCRGALVLLDDVAAAHVRCSIGAASLIAAGARSVVELGADVGSIAVSCRTMVAVVGGLELEATLPLLKQSIESIASAGNPAAPVEVTVFVAHNDAELAELARHAHSQGHGSVSTSVTTLTGAESEMRRWPGVSPCVLHLRFGPTTPFPGLCYFPGCAGSLVPNVLEVEMAAISLAGLLDTIGASGGSGLWSCGEAAKAVVGQVGRYRRPLPGALLKANVVVMDRALDLAGPASSLSSSVIGRIMNGLPEPAGTVGSADRDVSFPLWGHGTRAAPAGLAHPECPDVRRLLGVLLSLDERAGLHELRSALLQAGSTANVTLPLSAKMGKVTKKQLDSYLAPFAAADAAVLQHAELLQLTSVVADSLGKGWAPTRARAAPAEKTVMAAATDTDGAELLGMLVDLVPLPRKDGAPRAIEGGKDELLAPSELLLLAVVAYSLGFPSLDWDSEPQLRKVLTNLLATERPDLGDFAAVGETVGTTLEGIGELVRSRHTLKRYRSLMGDTTMAYEPLLKQIVADLFDSSVSEFPDLHKERGRGVGAAGGGGGGGRGGLLNTGLGLLGGMMGVGGTHPTDADVLVLVVLGGLTCEEIQEVQQIARQRDRKVQLLFAGTRAISTQQQVVAELFPFAARAD